MVAAMSSVHVSDVQCPVCKTSLQAAERRCATCLRPLSHAAWLAQSLGMTGTLVSALTVAGMACLALMLVSFCWLLASRQLGMNLYYPLLGFVACFMPLAALLGYDGWMSIRSGVDRTRVFLSTRGVHVRPPSNDR